MEDLPTSGLQFVYLLRSKTTSAVLKSFCDDDMSPLLRLSNISMMKLGGLFFSSLHLLRAERVTSWLCLTRAWPGLFQPRCGWGLHLKVK
jgi:hypothetical protein